MWLISVNIQFFQITELQIVTTLSMLFKKLDINWKVTLIPTSPLGPRKKVISNHK